jgi:hypothetical protein
MPPHVPLVETNRVLELSNYEQRKCRFVGAAQMLHTDNRCADLCTAVCALFVLSNSRSESSNQGAGIV